MKTDKQHYVVSFFHGTSGSFISSIVWRMINDEDKPIPLTTNNAAHIESPWERSWHHPEYGDCNTFNLFTGLTFDDIGLVKTHIYPDFEEVRNNLLTLKLIIMILEEKDITEVASNCVIKSDAPDPTAEQLRINFTYMYKHKWGSENEHHFWRFCDPGLVPDDLKDRILLIKYSDIYREQGDSFVAIEQIKKFTGKDIMPNTLQSYREYVNNRNKLWNK